MGQGNDIYFPLEQRKSNERGEKKADMLKKENQTTMLFRERWDSWLVSTDS